MINGSKKHIHTITIDPYAQTSFKIHDNNAEIFSISKPLPIKKDYLLLSYIKTNEFQMATIEIPKATKKDDFSKQLITKVYDELGLDETKEYKIAYTQINEPNFTNLFFNIFAVTQDTLKNDFMGIVNNTNCIDHIVVAPLLYSSLYKNGILLSDSIDCFIRFEKDDAFLVVYAHAELLAVRQIRYTLNFIKDKFCEQAGERISEQAFYEQLYKNGINDSQNEFDKNLSYVFDECFLYINDLISSINRIYNIDINFVFLDLPTGKISGLCEFADKRLNLKCSYINFPITSSKNTFNSTHALLALYAKNYDDNINFSIFKRPDPFYKQDSGKLIISALLGFVLAFAYPAFNYSKSLFLNIKTNQINNKTEQLKTEILQFQNSFDDLKQEQDLINEALNEAKGLLKTNQNLFDDIVNRQSQKNSVALTILKLTKMINKNDILLREYKQTDGNITLWVFSKDELKITNLIKSINNEYSVKVDQISNKNGYFDTNISLRTW